MLFFFNKRQYAMNNQANRFFYQQKKNRLPFVTEI